MPWNEDGSRKSSYAKKTTGFKMKYNSSAFPFKISPMKQYGTRPGERSGGKASERADQKLQNVASRREGRNMDNEFLYGSRTDGGEYKMGLADYRLFGGAGKKHLRASGLALEGDTEKHIKKNRRKRNRDKKGGKVDSWGNKIK